MKSASIAVLALISSLSVACRSQPPDPTAGTHEPASPGPSATATASAATSASATTDAGLASAADAAAPAEAEPKLEGANFVKEVQAAFRVAACAGPDEWIPANVDKKLVETHCAILKNGYAEYKKEWIDVAAPFIAKIRPKDLPTTVVYPFGGGDLMSELATYPDTQEVTTISLEIAGDVRPILKADNKRLDKELGVLREHLGKLFLKAHSRTVNLEIESRGAVPGEEGFTMAALALYGYEPVALRYFDFNPDGTLKWLTEDDIAKLEKAKGKSPFSNAEIRFKKPGERTRVLRHVAYDLSDGNLKKNPALIKYLDAEAQTMGKAGKVSAMTKAASHLLWDDANFATIRNWLMTHTDWMISDTTGVPPRIAKQYGFVQDVYGQYEGAEPFGTVNNGDMNAFIQLFKNAPPLGFRYGYPDNHSHGHMVVTRKNL